MTDNTTYVVPCRDWSCTRKAKWMVNVGTYKGNDYRPMCGPHRAGDERSMRSYGTIEPLRYISIENVLNGNGGPATPFYNDALDAYEKERAEAAERSRVNALRRAHNRAVEYNEAVREYGRTVWVVTREVERGRTVYAVHDVHKRTDDWNATRVDLRPPQEDTFGNRELASIRVTGPLQPSDPAQALAFADAFRQAAVEMMDKWPKGIDESWPEQVEVPPAPSEDK